MSKTQYIKAISEHDTFNDPMTKMLGEKGEEWTEELALKLIDGKIVDVIDIPFIQNLNEGDGNLPTENESQINVVKNPYLGHAKEEIKEIIKSKDFSCNDVVLRKMSGVEWSSLEIIRKKEIERAKNWRISDNVPGEEKPVSLQDLKRRETEKKFGISQDITKAKERVMNHLKERHPNVPEKTIKTQAKIKHLKRKINTSKLIGRDITD